MIRRALAGAVLTTLFIACRGREPAAGAGARASRDTAGVAVNTATAAGRVALELWQLRPGVTLGEWRGLHPDEAVLGADTSALSKFLGPWCAFSVQRAQAGAFPMLRAAYFYAPSPPPSLALPDSGSIDLVKSCVLGLVWINIEPGDSASAGALGDSVRQGLHAVFGGETAGTPHFYGSAFWSDVGFFRKDSLVAVSAVREPGLAAPNASDAQAARLVTAFAYLPSAGISVASDGGYDGPWTPADTFPLDSAAAVAHLDASLYARLRALAKDSGSADSLIAPLARWVRLATPLANDRRAAALYIADRVLDRALCSHALCDHDADSALAPLKALGAAFRWAELGATQVYTHGWLTQARGLSRDTPLGRRILLAQLNAALDFSGTCAGGTDGFRRVITTGETYLARVPDSPIAADVHYLVAEAYGDIVALAHGAGGEYADSARYAAEAAAAARQALAHYHAAITAGRGNAAARAAWVRAFRLHAGLPPRETRFFCVYD